MKHLINKNLFQGGGKDKPKPQPPLLKPPKLGAYKMLNSYSVAEVIDLISDGPIEGIVNQNGYRLGEGSSILQGIYLDNTPIEKTPSQQSVLLKQEDVIGDLDISETLKKLGNIYYEPNGVFKRDFHKPAVTLNGKFLRTDTPEAKIISTNAKEAGDSKEYYYSPLIGKILGKNNNNGNGWEWIGDLNDNSPRFFRTQITKDLEIHYEDPNQSLFSPLTLLTKIETKVKAANTGASASIKLTNEKIINKITNLKNSIASKKFNWSSKNTCFVVIEILNQSLTPRYTSSAEKKVLDNNGILKEVSFELSDFSSNIPQAQIHKIIIPEIQNDEYTGKVEGCLVIEIPTIYLEIEGSAEDFYAAQSSTAKTTTVPLKINYDFHYKRQIFTDLSGFIKDNTKLIFKKGPESDILGPSKYNFLNVSCEFKDGGEFQEPLEYFKNIYIDYDYASPLSGPFKTSGITRRIVGDWNTNGAKNPKLNIELGQEEGSNDSRAQTINSSRQSFSDWNDDNQYDELAIPIVHTIENPNVSSVFFTLGIASLSDTVSVSTDQKRDQGDKVPSIVEIEVEWGKISNGETLSSQTRKYAIAAIVEGQMLIDFGSPDLEDVENATLESVRDIGENTFETEAVLSKLFTLPSLSKEENPSITKRYIKITKLSAETNSVLLKKDISLYKVTEVLEQNFSYPFSSIVGVKIDARTFSSVPERTYDCRFKKIKIPLNYFPLEDNGIDKRYIKSETNYKIPNLVYDGDWNGEFKEGWTDNPAWIIYDLLTSKRYGLGSYLEPEQINIWELYKIGRFCDAVDSEGYFEGVSDGVGGLEPRYSCNIVFREQTKIFDAINIVASLFRGSVFFSNSEIQFLDDRPRDPISIFTNSNVKDGVFNYINNRRDQQFNTVEVAYLDRFDNYQTKIEYVQDEADIRKRGVFKTDINTLGVTSRAMARRIGQHLIYQTIKENQSIEFRAGLESLLCRPGDLVIVEDEMKTLSTNYGRILEKSLNTPKSLTIDNFYDTGSFTGKVTVYSPTGFTTSQELKDISKLKRNRVPYFDITGELLNSSDTALTGRYYFSGYAAGYATGNSFGLPSQVPLYTGSGSSGSFFCYYNTGATGFVFSTGLAYQNNNIYDKVICSTGLTDITYFESGADQTGYRYDSASPNKRGALSDKINENFIVEFKNSYEGILDSEISTVNNPQITTFDITGVTNLDYGARLFLDPNDININLLPLVSEGSVYRIQRKNATDQVYKIISIREENQNEYNVYASKYDTGKFKEIENHITSDFLPETFATSIPVINGQQIIELSPPNINTFTTGSISSTGFSLSGSWSGVAGATGYLINVENLTTKSSRSIIQASSPFNISGLKDMGYWEMRILSLATSPNIDSVVAKTGFFAAYQAAAQLTATAVVGADIK